MLWDFATFRRCIAGLGHNFPLLFENVLIHNYFGLHDTYPFEKTNLNINIESDYIKRI